MKSRLNLLIALVSILMVLIVAVIVTPLVVSAGAIAFAFNHVQMPAITQSAPGSTEVVINAAIPTLPGPTATFVIYNALPPSTPRTVDLPGQAALAYARALFVVDAHDQGAWLDALQSTMTPDGYLMYKSLVVPELWSAIEAAGIDNTADELDLQVDSTPAIRWVVDDPGSEISEWEVRDITVTFRSGASWPNVASPHQLHVQVERWRQTSTWAVSLVVTDQIVQSWIDQQNALTPAP